MISNEKVGQEIKRARMKNRLTQEGLADKIGVTKQAVSAWEKGKNLPDTESILLLKSVLGVDVYKLLEGEKKEMKIKPLKEIKELDELEQVIDNIVNQVEVEQTYSHILMRMLKMAMVITIAYECYHERYKNMEEDESGWETIAYRISSLINEEDEDPIPEEEYRRLDFKKGLFFKEKLYWMSYFVGGDLFEDFDDTGAFRHGFVQELARWCESNAFDLNNILPKKENEITMLYKFALLELSEKIDEMY